MSKLLVELEPGCWIAPWLGDPGRTIVMKAAKRFSDRNAAEKALAKARRFRAFEEAKVVELEEERLG